MRISCGKFFVAAASVLFIMVLIVMLKWNFSLLPPQTSSQMILDRDLTIGNLESRINITVFEEPCCPGCLEFVEEVFPKIKKKFIDTELISYTLVPLSFLPGSEPAVLASFCILYSNPSRPNPKLFMRYFRNLLAVEKQDNEHWATNEILLSCASDLEVNTDTLISCVTSKKYLKEVQKKNSYGQRLMGSDLATPTVFVNGRRLENVTFEEISRVVKQLEQSDKNKK